MKKNVKTFFTSMLKMTRAFNVGTRWKLKTETEINYDKTENIQEIELLKGNKTVTTKSAQCQSPVDVVSKCRLQDSCAGWGRGALILVLFQFLFRSWYYTVVVCPSVCLSITSRYCIKIAKCRITQNATR